MNTYVALLRGINVGGSKVMKMADLKALLTDNQFENVETYIQSGNLVVDHPEHCPKQVASRISELILSKWGYDVPCICLDLAGFQEAIHANPWPDLAKKDPKRVFVSFLPRTPSEKAKQQLGQVETAEDEYQLAERWMYIVYAHPGRAKLTNAVIECKLEMFTTARNWRTCSKLLSMLKMR